MRPTQELGRLLQKRARGQEQELEGRGRHLLDKTLTGLWNLTGLSLGGAAHREGPGTCALLMLSRECHLLTL